MLKKYLTCLLLACTALASVPSLAQLSDAEAMNMTGLQRSLTQRMAKNYLMIGADVRVDAAQRQLQETIQRFDASHRALTEYAPNAEIKAALAQVGSTWAVYRQQVEAKPEQGRAAQMLATSEQLLEQTQTVSALMGKHLGAMGASVHRSGWARVQTQRIAMLYMAKSWHIQAPELDEKLDKAVNDFESILRELEAGGAPSEEVAATQRRVRANWGFTLKGIDLHASEGFVGTAITISTDSLFRHLNELTRLYAGLQAKEA